MTAPPKGRMMSAVRLELSHLVGTSLDTFSLFSLFMLTNNISVFFLFITLILYLQPKGLIIEGIMLILILYFILSFIPIFSLMVVSSCQPGL